MQEEAAWRMNGDLELVWFENVGAVHSDRPPFWKLGLGIG